MTDSVTFPVVRFALPDRARAHDRILLLLVATLFASAWSLPGFAAFNAGALAGGVLLAVWMRVWHHAHPGGLDADWPGARRAAEINFASIPVGGNAGGLICTIGCSGILVLGVPGIGWFLLATLVAGVVFAGALSAWHAHGTTAFPRRSLFGRA